MLHKSKTEERRKAKYSTWICVKWGLKKVWQWDKRLAYIAIAMIPVGVGLYLLDLYSTSWILRSLETADAFMTVAMTVVCVMVAQMVFHIIRRLLSDADNLIGDVNSNRLWYEMLERGYRLDYQLSLDPDHRRLRDGAWALMGGNGYASPGTYLINFATMTVNVICFVFFGSVIAFLHPVIILLLIGGSLIVFFLQRRENKKNFELRDERNAADRKTDYISWYLSNDPAIGKDVHGFSCLAVRDKTAFLPLCGRF